MLYIYIKGKVDEELDVYTTTGFPTHNIGKSSRPILKNVIQGDRNCNYLLLKEINIFKIGKKLEAIIF